MMNPMVPTRGDARPVGMVDILERLGAIAERLDRIEAAMLKREDMHQSVLKPHSIEEWEGVMAGSDLEAALKASEDVERG